MQQGLVVDLDASLALRAARISVDLKLPMADSVILATARARCHAVDARFGFRGHRRCQVRRKKLTGELISAAQKGGEQHNIWSLRSERDSQVRMNSANAAALLSTSLADKLRANGVR